MTKTYFYGSTLVLQDDIVSHLFLINDRYLYCLFEFFAFYSRFAVKIIDFYISCFLYIGNFIIQPISLYLKKTNLFTFVLWALLSTMTTVDGGRRVVCGLNFSRYFHALMKASLIAKSTTRSLFIYKTWQLIQTCTMKSCRYRQNYMDFKSLANTFMDLF